MNIAQAELVAAVQADRMREATRRHRAGLATPRPRRRGASLALRRSGPAVPPRP